MSNDEYTYKVTMGLAKITKEDRKRGAVIAKFHKQAAAQNALLEDKMYYLILNDKPKDISGKKWMDMVSKVVRAEIVQKYPKLYPFYSRMEDTKDD